MPQDYNLWPSKLAKELPNEIIPVSNPNPILNNNNLEILINCTHKFKQKTEENNQYQLSCSTITKWHPTTYKIEEKQLKQIINNNIKSSIQYVLVKLLIYWYYKNKKLKNLLISSSNRRICLIALCFQLFIALTEQKKEGTVQYDYRNEELMHECFPKH